MPKPPTLEHQISTRFLEVLADHTGPGKRYRFKKHFGEAIGMRQQEIIKVENGSTVQYRHMVKLYELFRLNLNWALTGKGEKYMSKSNGQMSLEQRVAKIEKVINAASATQSSKLRPKPRKESR